MGEIIEFPKKKESDAGESKQYAHYYQLLDELGILESKLKTMADAVDNMVFAEIPDKAHDLLIELQVELAEMREKKFFSPIKRRKILAELRELRQVWKESGPLLEEYEKKSMEIYSLGKELGIPQEE